MIPFLLCLALFCLLNTKLLSQTWLIEIAKDFFYVFLTILIFMLLASLLLFLGYNDFSLMDTIYCDGGDDTDSLSGSTKPTNLDAPGNNTNINANSHDPNSNTNSSKIQLDSEKYYHVRKDSVDKAIDLASKGIEQAAEKIVANVGAATAAGTAAATILKSNLPLVPKLAIAGASAAVVGASTKIGIGIGEAVLTRSKENPTTNVLTKIDPDRIPSPTEFYVPSIIETSELISPLEELIRYQFILNFLILFSIVILIALLFNKMFLSKNIFVSFIERFFNKDIVSKFESYKIKIDKFNNSFFFLLFWLNAITRYAAV